jgi:hypothetical protein
MRVRNGPRYVAWALKNEKINAVARKNKRGGTL